MPAGRIKVTVRPFNGLTLQRFRLEVENQLAQLQVARRRINWAIDPDDNTVILDVEFVATGSARVFRQWVEDNLTRIRLWVRGRLSSHLCSHDDLIVYSCREDGRSQFREVQI